MVGERAGGESVYRRDLTLPLKVLVPGTSSTIPSKIHQLLKNNFVGCCVARALRLTISFTNQQASKDMFLKGKNVLVAGATGEVGRGAAFALSQAGAKTTLVGRSAAKLQQIQHTLPGPSTVIAADYSTLDGAQELAKQVEGKTFDLVVASSGPWWNATLAEGDLATLHNAVAANFQAQLYLYNVLILKCTGQYIMVNGTAALGLPNSGLTGVMANACVGAAKVMHHETKAKSVDFTHALISSSVGHSQFRAKTHDPNEFGRVFVAMFLNMHLVDADGTTLVDDQCYKDLVDKL